MQKKHMYGYIYCTYSTLSTRLPHQHSPPPDPRQTGRQVLPTIHTAIEPNPNLPFPTFLTSN
jgi:hypothetical protein